MAGKPRGGARPGAGRPKGTKNPATITKEAARLALAQIVIREMDELVAAQISNAKGIHFLVVREKTSGKFLRVSKGVAEKLNPEEEIIEVWQKDPSVQAFTDLMNRALDKPKEQEIDVNVRGDAELVARLTAARLRNR